MIELRALASARSRCFAWALAGGLLAACSAVVTAPDDRIDASTSTGAHDAASATLSASAAPPTTVTVDSTHPIASTSAPAIGSAGIPAVVSRDPDPRHGVVLWMHETKACSAAGAVGPPKPAGIPKVWTETDSGRLPMIVIRRVLLQRRLDLQRCYEASPAGAACRDARVFTQFVIEGDGKVSSVSGPRDDRDEPHDRELAGCVATVLGQTQFPSPESGVVQVTMPLRFLK